MSQYTQAEIHERILAHCTKSNFRNTYVDHVRALRGGGVGGGPTRALNMPDIRQYDFLEPLDAVPRMARLLVRQLKIRFAADTKTRNVHFPVIRFGYERLRTENVEARAVIGIFVDPFDADLLGWQDRMEAVRRKDVPNLSTWIRAEDEPLPPIKFFKKPLRPRIEVVARSDLQDDREAAREDKYRFKLVRAYNELWGRYEKYIAYERLIQSRGPVAYLAKLQSDEALDKLDDADDLYMKCQEEDPDWFEVAAELFQLVEPIMFDELPWMCTQ